MKFLSRHLMFTMPFLGVVFGLGINSANGQDIAGQTISTVLTDAGVQTMQTLPQEISWVQTLVEGGGWPAALALGLWMASKVVTDALKQGIPFKVSFSDKDRKLLCKIAGTEPDEEEEDN